MIFGDYLSRRCVYSPDKVGVVYVAQKSTVRFTYRAMNERANSLAGWLQQQGVNKGDRVAMLAYDGMHFYDAFFACGKIGAVFVPYNWRLHPKEIETQIGLTAPLILLHSEDEAITEILDDLETSAATPRFHSLANEKLMAANIKPVLCESITENDSACLLFTGGTTGMAKAAQISHKQVVWNTFNAQLADVLGTDTFLNIFPMFHAGGLFAFSVPMLILGGKIVQTEKFEAVQTLTLIKEEKVTIFGGVPTIFQMLTEASNWNSADLTPLRYCLSGGAPMPVSLIEKYQREKGVVFRQGFGMTEFGPDVFSLASEDSLRKAGSIGKPNFFVDANIISIENGNSVPCDEVGELVLRGPSATTGYFGNPEATKAAFDEEGYFHTGDLAYTDEDGYFFIVDRLKDMFISGGENVYPAEIEAVLYQHPAVSMCAVVGVSDEKWGQAGCAFVVPRKDESVEAESILLYLRENLAKYKVPKKVIMKDSLPISGAGKIVKSELRKLMDSNV